MATDITGTPPLAIWTDTTTVAADTWERFTFPTRNDKPWAKGKVTVRNEGLSDLYVSFTAAEAAAYVAGTHAEEVIAPGYAEEYDIGRTREVEFVALASPGSANDFTIRLEG